MIWAKRLDALIGGLIAVLFGGALVLASLGIVSRYIHWGVSLDWVGEVVIFLSIWAILLAMPRAELRATHVKVDFFSQNLPAHITLRIRVLIAVFTLMFGAFYVLSGIEVVGEALRWDERTPSVLAIPLWIYYMSLPMAFGLLIVMVLSKKLSEPPLPNWPVD